MVVIPTQSVFNPGQTIVLREIWRGKLWSARPEIVVQDKPELLALYVPPGTIWNRPQALDGKRVTAVNRAHSEWKLHEEAWTGSFRLRMTIPGADYSVLIFWDAPYTGRYSWYINLEDPLRRTAGGFEYMDQILDIIVSSDLSSWHWKDKDEFQEAVFLGMISTEKADTMRREGKKVVEWLQSGKSPFNSWENWVPERLWGIPVLPLGWETI
jgi:hypothetical protein